MMRSTCYRGCRANSEVCAPHALATTAAVAVHPLLGNSSNSDNDDDADDDYRAVSSRERKMLAVLSLVCERERERENKCEWTFSKVRFCSPTEKRYSVC